MSVSSVWDPWICPLLIELLLGWLASLVKSQRRLRAENLVLRHQLNILRWRGARRLRLLRYGSAGVRLALSALSGRSSRRDHHQARDHHRLAPTGISSLLALEVTVQGWSTASLRGDPRPDPRDEPSQLFMGCAAHPDEIAVPDLFVVPTIGFKLLYCLVILSHG